MSRNLEKMLFEMTLSRLANITYITCHSWVSVLQPSSTDVRVLFVNDQIHKIVGGHFMLVLISQNEPRVSGPYAYNSKLAGLVHGLFQDRNPVGGVLSLLIALCAIDCVALVESLSHLVVDVVFDG